MDALSGRGRYGGDGPVRRQPPSELLDLRVQLADALEHLLPCSLVLVCTLAHLLPVSLETQQRREVRIVYFLAHLVRDALDGLLLEVQAFSKGLMLRLELHDALGRCLRVAKQSIHLLRGALRLQSGEAVLVLVVRLCESHNRRPEFVQWRRPHPDFCYSTRTVVSLCT